MFPLKTSMTNTQFTSQPLVARPEEYQKFLGNDQDPTETILKSRHQETIHQEDLYLAKNKSRMSYLRWSGKTEKKEKKREKSEDKRQYSSIERDISSEIDNPEVTGVEQKQDTVHNPTVINTCMLLFRTIYIIMQLLIAWILIQMAVFAIKHWT